MNEAGKILSALSKTCSLFRIDSVSFKVKYRVMLAEILEDPLTKDSILLVTVEQYHYLGEVGLIPEKTELLEGVIITKMPKSPVHRFIVIKLYKILSKLINENFVIQKEDPLTFIHSEPEPDISIIPASPDEYKTSHPTSAEFVIEVAVSSLRIDRLKLEIYAEAKIPEYWIVNVTTKSIEVYKNPEGRDYKEKGVYSVEDILSFPAFLNGEIQIKDLFE